MTEKIVAGCVVVALIILALLGYAQTHHDCRHGRVLNTLEHCGAPNPSI
jgi:hypothetical protein